ncbi:hypothetical protein [Glycomyces buryatensis]|uniref:Uncharacterized protein n=1 Tax=Glycomyces buryatensis TaxID=2570927 RepID=A0A4S8Q896_9ACTN|nr:hypothetical protein [Glycomyces buryatensis]THV39601.1 hypothetical protein FAB82_17170 [Glycomyces buryatensis]
MTIPYTLPVDDELVHAIDKHASKIDVRNTLRADQNRAALAAAVDLCARHSQQPSGEDAEIAVEFRGTAATARSWLCEYAARATGARLLKLEADPLLAPVHASVPVMITGPRRAVHACHVLADLLDRIAWQAIATTPTSREALWAVNELYANLLPFDPPPVQLGMDEAR